MLEAFPEFIKVLQDWRKEYYGRLSSAIEQQKNQGTISDDVPAMTAAVTLTGIGFWHCLFVESFNIGDEVNVSRSDLMDFYNRLWYRGLSANLPKARMRNSARADVTHLNMAPLV
jgi:hypothetical protein